MRKGGKETEKEGRREINKERKGSGSVWKNEFATGEIYDSKFIARTFRQKMRPRQHPFELKGM